jgi:hypothetical protein
MAPDRTILHLVIKKIPDPLPLSRIMACTLLSLSYAPGGTRLLWDPRDRLRFLSKLKIWGAIKPLVNFHKCIISSAVECPDNIYFIQSSDKHNMLMQCVICLSCFIVDKIWSTAIKIIYQICFLSRRVKLIVTSERLNIFKKYFHQSKVK